MFKDEVRSGGFVEFKNVVHFVLTNPRTKPLWIKPCALDSGIWDDVSGKSFWHPFRVLWLFVWFRGYRAAALDLRLMSGTLSGCEEGGGIRGSGRFGDVPGALKHFTVKRRERRAPGWQGFRPGR